MPRLQKLVDQYRNRPDVMFLSLNMDENPGLVEPFMTEHHLSITALPAYAYVTQTLKVNGIPQNWIVDADGVIRLKGIGYDSTEKWEQGMKDAIEKCEPSGGAPATPAVGAGTSASSGGL